jgi:hypothetical protein
MPVAQPSVAELVGAALQRGADSLWLAMLPEDPVYGKIPAEQRRPAVEQAAAFGQRAARDLRARLGTADPAALAERLGVRMEWSEAPYVFGKIVQTSTYTQRLRTVTIYAGSVAEMNRFLATEDLGPILGLADVGPVYLAHELFHHLEEDSLGRAANLVRVTTLKLGPLVRRSGIGQLSEIAADAFAQALLGLSFAPRLLDYLTVWIHNPEAGRRRLRALTGL